MKLRNYLTILSVIGGLAFGAANLSANCGGCTAGQKKEHASSADCQKDCCKDKKKEGCGACKKECSDDGKCSESCAKDCSKEKKKKEG